jgi:hypothetical protein
MISAPIFWGVTCGAIYFVAMWWIHTRRLDRQRESTRLLYVLSEQIVAAHTPSGIEERLKETLPRLLNASHVEMELGTTTNDSRALVLPLISHEQTLGAIKVYRTAMNHFIEEDRAAAQHIANIVAAALQLQKHQTPREKPPAPRGPPLGGGSLTLMLIDPDPESRRTILQMLSSRGHRVIPVAAEEAPEMARRVRFDAVLHVSDEVRETTGQLDEFWLVRPVGPDAIDRILSQIRKL